MSGRGMLAVGAAFVLGATAVGTAAATTGGETRGGPHQVHEVLSGYQEDPAAISTSGTGRFVARIDDDARTMTYTLSYAALQGSVLQSHIHLGGVAQSGGISVFLCTNLGNGPAGTQACPAAPATITGTISAGDVIGPAGQGIGAGEFDELVTALRAGKTYVNVHSSLVTSGEIRAQLVSG